MAEQHSKPRSDDKKSEIAEDSGFVSSRQLLPIGLGLILLLAGCFFGGNQSTDPDTPDTPAPTLTQSSRSPEADAAITRVASSLAVATIPAPTNTPLPIKTAVAGIPLPTVTPTLVPSPVATRTIELSGDATIQVRLNNSNFQSNGQPVTISIKPRTYILGGDTLAKSDKWCLQAGATGVVFDLEYSLEPVSQALNIGGKLELYDGFCGEWGKLGNLLSSIPMNVTVPTGSSAYLSPMLQAQGSFMGVPHLLDISTGIALNLNIRNPSPE